MTWWQSPIDGPGRTLTADDLKVLVERIYSPEATAAERSRVKRNTDAYVGLRTAAQKAGVADHPDVIIALAHAAHGSPVSPGLYERVRKLIEAQP